MASSGILNKPNAHSKTVVLHDDPSRRARPSFNDLINESWNLLPPRLRAYRGSFSHPRLLLILGVAWILFSVLSLYYYNKFASEIDARLNRSSLDNTVEIVTPPFRVSVGDRLAVNELCDHLRAGGYQQQSGPVNEASGGTFEVVGSSVSIFPSDALTSQPGVDPVKVQVDNKGKIISLSDPTSGEKLSSAAIQGKLLAAVNEGDRRKKIKVQFADIPEKLRNAIIAAEDRRFFSHSGIDWRGIMRALKTDIDQGEFVQGGSTITQQIIKNSFLTSDRTVKRKLKEAAMASILELRLTKEEIFTHYCNGVYLGHHGSFAINGFAQAARVYFDKDLNELSLAQSAFLAGLICAPNRFSAHRDKARATERRNFVLDAMVETEAITRQEADEAKAEPLQIKKTEIQDDDGASYFIDYVQRFIEDRYSADRLATRNQITTTIDPRIQKAAYEAVKRHTEKLDKVVGRRVRKGEQAEPVQAALVALDAHTGEVLAMVGGRSYDESQLNRATDARRQPGSAFKPFVYATALSSRSFTAATLLSDRPKTFTFDGGRAEYKPEDFHGGFTNRNVTLREALARSLNVPTVELAISTGLHRVAEVAEASGLDKPRVYPSMALGTSEVTPLQLAAAYTAFANAGTAVRPIPVRSVSASGASSDRISSSTVNVFSPQVAYLMTHLMQAVVDQGTASKLRAMGVTGAIAGKTGTSNDGWFVGYTPQIVCVAWVGFDDNRDLGMKASDTALPLWADFMREVVQLRGDLGSGTFGKPGGLVTVEIDPVTGCLPSPGTVGRPELFLAGTEPSSPCFSENTEDLEELTESLEASQDVEPTEPDEEAEEVQGDTVPIQVCALTGLRASLYCVKTEIRRFARDNEPRTCRPEFHDD